jgi:hypothetical protein
MMKKSLAPLLWLAYVIVPVEGWGLFDGRPLGAVESLAIAVFCWLWWAGRAPRAAAWGAAALLAKIAIGATLLLPRGFDARYHANAEFAGPVERGTEPAEQGFTRVDPQLSFGSAGTRDLPVHFFNDSSRFSYYLPGEPARATLPASVIWEGWLQVERPGVRRVYLRAAGSATLSIGDGLEAVLQPPATEWVGYPDLRQGFQRIRITLAIPQGTARAFEAGWTFDGRELPFDSAAVFRRPATTLRLVGDRIARVVSAALDIIFSGWLMVGAIATFAGAWRRVTGSRSVRDALTIGWVAIALDAFLNARPFLHRMVTLSGGDDWLTYETRARDIALNSLWMLGGAELGHGRAFFEMPFYPYFLAATHWGFGDGLYGAYLLQRLLLGATVIALWRITATFAGERVGCAGLLASLVIVYVKVAPWSGTLLTELLFIPLVSLAVLRLVRLATAPQPSLRSAAVAGAVSGFATLTRSTLMLAWPLALPLVAFSLRPTRRAGRILVMVGLAMLAVISVATVRNWVVARQFVLVNAYGSFNVLLANQPPASQVVPAGHKATYDRLGLDENIQSVVEYARQSPRLFFDAWQQRTAYALGFFDTIVPDRGRSAFYVAAWSLALVGVVLLTAGRPWLPTLGPPALIPLSIALAHFCILIMTFVTVYGDRLLLPFYALLAPYVGVTVFGAHSAMWRLTGPRSALVMWVVLCGVCVVRLLGGAPELSESILAVAMLVWSLCVFGVPRLPAPAVVVYGGLAAGLFTWAALDGTADVQAMVRMDLLLLMMALGSSVLVTGGVRLRVPDTPIFVWAGVGVTVVTLAVLHRLDATAPAMILAGLVLGAVQSISIKERLHAS